jgi:hypothetical protein
MTGHVWLDVLIGIAGAILLTCLLLIAALDIRRPTGKMRQLAAAYRRFSSSGALPGRNRTPQQKLLALVGYCCLAVAILDVVWFGLLLSRPPVERAMESSSTQSATPGGVSSSAARSPASAPRKGSKEEIIQVAAVADSARPFQSVRIQGRYRGGADTLLRVQRWEASKWRALSVRTKTDQSGKFTTYVEFEQPGRYRIRVIDPNSGVTSKPCLLVIKG